MTKAVKTVQTSKPTTQTPSVKDSGAVKIGGGAIRFKSTSVKDAGAVKIGGGAIRF